MITAPGLDVRAFRNQILIDGKFRNSISGRTFETRNPATGELLTHVAEGDAGDIDAAVKSSRRAFSGPWRKFSPFERQAGLLRFAELVDQHFEELVMLDVLDMGVPITIARGRQKRALGLLRYYAGACVNISGATLPNSLPGDVFTYTLKRPVGVVGAITPWNGPIIQTIWKIGPVLATGCTVVVKPAEEAPLTTLRLGELVLEAGIPEGVVNVVPGFGHTAGAALASHTDVDKISFTGSNAVGQKIIAASASNIKRVTLELGGKSPNVFFSDCDIEAAVQGAATGAFANTGQVCYAGTRLLVQRPIYSEFVERLSAIAGNLKIGGGIDPQTQIGPVVSKAQLQRIADYIKIGSGEGAEVCCGGKLLDTGNFKDGFFIQPTVLTNVRNNMKVAQDEIFGPVACAIPFDTVEEATTIANATTFGLGAGVWTRNVKTAHYMSENIQAGTVWVNTYSQLDPSVPFGGLKSSGYGKEGGLEQIADYLATKAVIMNLS